MGRLFCVRRVKREAKSWSFTRRDPSWCSDEVIYRFLSWNISVPQDSSSPKVTHERFFTLCLPERGALTQALSTLVDLLLPKYVSNCSNWSWIPLFCILFGIGQQNKIERNVFLLALQKRSNIVFISPSRDAFFVPWYIVKAGNKLIFVPPTSLATYL